MSDKKLDPKAIEEKEKLVAGEELDDENLDGVAGGLSGQQAQQLMVNMMTQQ